MGKKASVVIFVLQFAVILLLSGVCIFQWKTTKKQSIVNLYLSSGNKTLPNSTFICSPEVVSVAQGSIEVEMKFTDLIITTNNKLRTLLGSKECSNESNTDLKQICEDKQKLRKIELESKINEMKNEITHLSQSTKEYLSKKCQVDNKVKIFYFDDFQGRWGNGNADGSTTWKAGDSKYAARTAPGPVINPLKLNTMSQKLIAVPRSEVIAAIDPENQNNYMPLIDDRAKKYGEAEATYFIKTDNDIVSKRFFDVDNDKIDEEIIETVYIGGNHPPYDGFIIKNGTIILSFPLNSGGIEPSADGNGFYVKHIVNDDQPACCPLKYRLYRVVYENGVFTPVWEQEVTYLRFAP